MAVTITMAADVTMDVITAGDFPAEIIPAAIFFGSSFFYACAEIMAGAATTDAVTETAAGSLSYCFCCVAMDVAAAADNHYLPAEGNFPLPFSSVLEPLFWWNQISNCSYLCRGLFFISEYILFLLLCLFFCLSFFLTHSRSIS